MFRKNKLSVSVMMMGAAGMLSPMTVLAQDDESSIDVVEEVFVTGSRLLRSDATSSAPVTVLSSEDLMTAGTPTLENFLQDLPSISGADFGSSVNNGNRGYATASLRGLGPIRTLVLINGRRPASAGTNGFVDLNSIPTSVVERIEVLRDGASTIYGSDAIAGVINIITKKEFEGLEADVQYDVSGEGDGESYLASLTFGRVFERGNILLNAQYTKRADIWQRDRDFSACPLREVQGKLVCGGSGTAYPAQINGQSVVDSTTGVLRDFTTADQYNFAASSYMVTPQEVYSFFGNADYRIIENGSFSTLDTYMEVGFSNRVSDQLLAPVGTFWAPSVDVDHPNNPLGNARTDGGTPASVTITRRLAETGGRSFNQDASSWRAVFGFKGEFNNSWTWDASFNYSRYVDTQIVQGQINRPRIEALLSPTKCAADTDCPGIWNPFITNSLTAEMQKYALVTHSPVVKSRMLQSQFTLTGDFYTLELPGGKPAWAIGYERRAEFGSVTPDGAAALGQIYSVAADKSEGSYAVEEFYAELSLPIFNGVFLAEELSVDVSGRYTDYSFLPSQNTFKYGINWAPTEDVRFRYNFSEGFRAPNLGERFAPQNITAASYSEPCQNYADETNANVIANCIADGLPPDFKLSSNQATGRTGGNVNLKPETSESQSLGVVLTPRFLPDFTATLDYFNIELEQAIGAIGTNDIITNCYQSANFSSPLCALMGGPVSVGDAPHATSPYRDVLGAISGQILINDNLATFETQGIDFDFTYNIESSFADVELKLFGTWLESYEYLAADGLDVVSLAGKFGTDPYQGDNPAAFPEWKTNLRATIRQDYWSGSLTARYISETEDVSPKPSQLQNVADSIWYLDAQGSYQLGDLTLTAGVRNLLDETPPYVTNNSDMNTLNFSYDTAGRYLYTRIGVKF